LFSKDNLLEPVGIGHVEDDPAPLNATKSNNEESEVAEESIRVATLVHPQSIIQVKGPLLLLDQLVLGRDVVAERVLASVATKVLSSCSSRCRECPGSHQSALASEK